jgi:hypothetical protein
MKSKERILLNGVWYVRETPIEEVEIKPNEVTNAIYCTWESKSWAFTGHVLLREDAETLDDYYDHSWIDITDKRFENGGDWVEHKTDNPNWYVGILEGNPESMVEADEIFDEQGLVEFRAFIRYLINRGWIKRENKGL